MERNSLGASALAPYSLMRLLPSLRNIDACAQKGVAKIAGRVNAIR
jgi:hypothetical protein